MVYEPGHGGKLGPIEARGGRGPRDGKQENETPICFDIGRRHVGGIRPSGGDGQIHRRSGPGVICPAADAGPLPRFTNAAPPGWRVSTSWRRHGPLGLSTRWGRRQTRISCAVVARRTRTARPGSVSLRYSPSAPPGPKLHARGGLAQHTHHASSERRAEEPPLEGTVGALLGQTRDGFNIGIQGPYVQFEN